MPSATKFTTAALAKLPPPAQRTEVRDPKVTGLHLRVTPAGAKTFAVVYRRDGRLVRYTIGPLGRFTVETARAEAQKVVGQAKSHGAPDPQKAKKAARVAAQREAQIVTLRAYIADTSEFAGRLRAERRSAAEDLARVRSAFPALLDRKLPAITRWDLRRWRKDRKDDGVSDSTIDRDLTALSAVLADALEQGLIATHPVRKQATEKRNELMPALDSRKAARYLTPDQQRRLRDALAARDEELRQARARGNAWRKARSRPPMPAHGKFADHLTPMVLLLLNTGLRPGRELFELTWENVNLPARTLEVPGAIAKHGKSRTIPLNAEAVAVLRDWQKITNQKAGLIFPGRAGRPFDNIKTAWDRVAAAAGLGDMPPYCTRHTFGTALVNANVPLPVISELMGHSDLRTTSRYLHTTDAGKKAAVAALVATR